MELERSLRDLNRWINKGQLIIMIVYLQVAQPAIGYTSPMTTRSRRRSSRR